MGVAIPSLNEQHQIVRALDTETAEIDELIAEQRQMVELLEEKWKAVLSTAFGPTNGIRLKHLLNAPLAYGVLVPEHDPSGVPMLRIMDLTVHGVDLESSPAYLRACRTNTDERSWSRAISWSQSSAP